MNSGSLSTGEIISRLDSILSGTIAEYVKNNSTLIDQLILQKNAIFDIQKENISFWYSHIQSILGRLAIVGLLLFLGGYSYIRYQAKKAINQIKEEKEVLESKYDILVEKTQDQISNIKDNNEFQILLMKGLSLKANKKLEDALDHYDNMLSQQFIQQDSDKMYGVYKEIADAHYLIGENGEQTYENASNYFNALSALDEASKIYSKEEDENFRGNLQDKYDQYTSLEPSEQ